MNLGIGEGKTREDHRAVANQLYAAYAQGRDLRKLVAIVGEEALSEVDRAYLRFADEFERASWARAGGPLPSRRRSRSAGS
jgi:V/A-type H+/Na+-transporting ATPase subunit B